MGGGQRAMRARRMRPLGGEEDGSCKANGALELSLAKGERGDLPSREGEFPALGTERAEQPRVPRPERGMRGGDTGSTDAGGLASRRGLCYQ